MLGASQELSSMKDIRPRLLLHTLSFSLAQPEALLQQAPAEANQVVLTRCDVRVNAMVRTDLLTRAFSSEKKSDKSMCCLTDL